MLQHKVFMIGLPTFSECSVLSKLLLLDFHFGYSFWIFIMVYIMDKVDENDKIHLNYKKTMRSLKTESLPVTLVTLATV